MLGENKVDPGDKPMPTAKGDVIAATILKSIIGIAAVADIVCFTISVCNSKDSDNQSDAGGEQDPFFSVTDGISYGATVTDYALSYCLGFLLYSPMDASSLPDDSEYGKIIAATSKACKWYTIVWYIKTVLSLGFPTVIAVVSCSCLRQKITDKAKKNLKKIDNINTVLGAVMSALSAGLEVWACVEAGQVDDDRLNEAQKTDKKCFLWETSGYICDDVRTIFNAIITICQLKEPWVLSASGVLAAGYASAMFAEAGYIRGTWKV
jgi:hypothetical protein